MPDVGLQVFVLFWEVVLSRMYFSILEGVLMYSCFSPEEWIEKRGIAFLDLH